MIKTEWTWVPMFAEFAEQNLRERYGSEESFTDLCIKAINEVVEAQNAKQIEWDLPSYDGVYDKKFYGYNTKKEEIKLHIRDSFASIREEYSNLTVPIFVRKFGYTVSGQDVTEYINCDHTLYLLYMYGCSEIQEAKPKPYDMCKEYNLPYYEVRYKEE